MLLSLIGYLFVEQHTVCHRATHAIIESSSNFGKHSETSVRQLDNQLISVVVVLDNLALSATKIGTTETFYHIIVFVKLKIKFLVKSSV